MATGDVSLEPAGAGVKPTSCRDWAPRAWPGPRADARCESPLVSFLEPDLDADPDAAPLSVRDRLIPFRRSILRDRFQLRCDSI